MASVGLRVPRSVIVRTTAEEARGRARRRAAAAGRDPARRSRSAATAAASRARVDEYFEAIVARGLRESPISQVLRRGVGRGLGRVRARGDPRPARQRRDHLLDREHRPDGRAHGRLGLRARPSMTLSDREYQTLRDAAATVIRAVGVETGGSNVQFARQPRDRRDRRDRDEPARLALARRWPRRRRATRSRRSRRGSPSATRSTRSRTTSPARRRPRSSRRSTTSSSRRRASRSRSSRAPTSTLTTQMKSVGEAMGIGRNFCEAYGKTMRSRELDRDAARGRRARIAGVGSLRRAARAHARGRGRRRAVGRSQHPPLVLRRARAHASRSSTTPRARGLAGLDAEAHAPAQAPRRLRRAHRAPLTGCERGGRARAPASSSACGRSSRRSTRAAARSPPRPRTCTRATTASTSRSSRRRAPAC